MLGKMGWGELPPVVLLGIYDCLSVKGRLTASAVCKNWRGPVFQVPLSNDELVLKLRTEEDVPKVKFVSGKFAVKVEKLSLLFDASTLGCLEVVEEILVLLEGNAQLKSLRIRFTEESFFKNIFGENASFNTLILKSYFIKKVLKPLKNVLVARNCLETLSFPFIQELASRGCEILNGLAKSNKAHSIKKLFLATAIEAGSSSQSSLFTSWSLHSFGCLQMLSLNHDVLSDSLLATLGLQNRLGGLKRLNLKAVQGNPDVSNSGWTTFVENNSSCSVRLTVTGRSVVVDHTSNLLFPATPLTHFRAMYCKGIEITFLNALIRWNLNSLEHLELVDEGHDWMVYLNDIEELDGDEFLDPFIFAAWRCPNLRSIKIGILYCGHNLVALTSFTGSNLLSLEIAKSQLVYHSLTKLSEEVSKALGRKWQPLDDDEKHKTTNDTMDIIHTTMRALYEDEK